MARPMTSSHGVRCCRSTPTSFSLRHRCSCSIFWSPPTCSERTTMRASMRPSATSAASSPPSCRPNLTLLLSRTACTTFCSSAAQHMLGESPSRGQATSHRTSIRSTLARVLASPCTSPSASSPGVRGRGSLRPCRRCKMTLRSGVGASMACASRERRGTGLSCSAARRSWWRSRCARRDGSPGVIEGTARENCSRAVLDGLA
mmetsp:Transcript_35311/g.92676  ORF Transcript_35311/g.92676 Transcript_35311/m.92676 type:complete len:203 (-) Transcript_35311:425-1033(-)